MILNADALEIIAYLKTAGGKFVSMREISLKAGGRRRFEDTPDWARNLMQPLLEAGHIQVNSRGHYRAMVSEPPLPKAPTNARPHPPRDLAKKVIGDDYFPSKEVQQIVGGDYFPTEEMD
jgi:hypothetical protein